MTHPHIGLWRIGIWLGILLLALVACGTPPASGGRLEATPPAPLSASQSSATFVLRNAGASTLSWTIAVQNASSNPQAGDWFTVSPASGTLAAGAQTDVTLTLRSGLAAGTYRATLIVNYPGGPTRFEVEGTVGGQAAGGFTLDVDDVTNTVAPGAEVRIPVGILRQGGFADEVRLEVLGAPEGLTGAFEPAATTGTESTLTVTTQDEVAAGNYTLTVRGVAGNRSDTAEITVSVIGTTTDPTFSLAVTPGNLTVTPGSSATATVSVRRAGGFENAVTLSAQAPSGVTVSFDPASADASSAVAVRVGSGVQPGSYTITIRGESGSRRTSTRLGLTVPAPSSGSDGRITGRLRTDAFLGDFTVPDNVTGEVIRAQSAAARPEYVPGQVLVALASGLVVQGTGGLELAQSFAARQGLRLLEVSNEDVLVLEVAATESVPEVAARLAAEPGVRYAEPNYYIYPLAVPTDPLYRQQWHLAGSGVSVAWDALSAATGVTVAVIDSGFELNHNDLGILEMSPSGIPSGIFLPGYDFCGSAQCATRDTNVNPDGGAGSPDTHGTHVAGVLAARANNQGGVGVLKDGARVVPVKVFYEYTYTTAARLAEAIRWAAGESVSGVPANANPAKIINLSLGTPSDSQTVRDAVTAAQNRGALLVAAAGNAGHTGQGVLYPARYEGVVAVGSVNSAFQRSCFSNTGPEIDVLAPGGDGFICTAPRDEAVLSTIPNRTYGALVGTSQAAPIVSGVAALIWAAEPSLTASQVRQRLRDRAHQVNGLRVVRADLALGFPGPGSSFTVSANGAGSAVDTVTLRADGSSNTFTLANLGAGAYTVTADGSGTSRSLSASQSVSLAAGETRSVVLRLE